MPVTGARGRTHEAVPENSASMGLDPTSFLFDDEEKSKESATSPGMKSLLEMNEDNFPILVRRGEQPGVVRIANS